MLARLIALAGAVAVAGGCGTVATPPEAGPDHPADPQATEAPLPPASATLAIEPVQFSPLTTPSTETEAPPDGARTGKVVYTCPMHPAVVSDAPGECPICGMELVEKEGQQ